MVGRTTQFFYDAVSNRTKVIDPDSRTTYYTYDKVGRLTGISVYPDSRSAGYWFDPTGRITTEVKPNSAVTYYEYDDAGRLIKIENRKSDQSVISSFEYNRDKAGNITRCHRADGTVIYYQYDKAQELVSEVWKDSGISTIYSYQYDYDGVGNRTKLLRDLGGGAESIYYYYDAANRIEKEWNTTAPTATYFGYNNNGSVTKIQTSSGTTYFEYNDSDLVRKITYPDSSINEFYYDGRNRRVVISDSDGSSYFDWDGVNPVEEYGDTDTKYIHGYSPIAGAGSLAYAKRGNSYQVPHKDHIGSSRELSDASEVVTQYYEYDAFGTKLEATGSQTNRFQFAANYMKLKDLDNVYLSPTRVYHAGIGRFLQKDRIVALNRFVYVSNHPLRLVDPFGLQEQLMHKYVRIELKDGTSEWGTLLSADKYGNIVLRTNKGEILICKKDIDKGPVLFPHTEMPPAADVEEQLRWVEGLLRISGMCTDDYSLWRTYKLLDFMKRRMAFLVATDILLRDYLAKVQARIAGTVSVPTLAETHETVIGKVVTYGWLRKSTDPDVAKKYSDAFSKAIIDLGKAVGTGLKQQAPRLRIQLSDIFKPESVLSEEPEGGSIFTLGFPVVTLPVIRELPSVAEAWRRAAAIEEDPLEAALRASITGIAPAEPPQVPTWAREIVSEIPLIGGLLKWFAGKFNETWQETGKATGSIQLWSGGPRVGFEGGIWGLHLGAPGETIPENLDWEHFHRTGERREKQP